MTAAQTAALLLTAALLMTPAGARHRLGIPAAGRLRSVKRIAAFVVLPGSAAIAVAASATLAIACAAVATVVVVRRRRSAHHRRRRDEARAMADALDVLVGELRVGAHPLRALAVAASDSAASDSAASDSTGKVGAGLRTVAARAYLGADVPAGMRAIAADSAVPVYWDRLAVFWQLASEHGLAMSTLMRAAHRDIADRQRFTEGVQAALAGARATAVVLALLPGLGILLGQFVGAGPIRFLLGAGPGSWLLMLGVGLACAGILWADLIIDGVAS